MLLFPSLTIVMTDLERKTITQAINEVWSLELDGYQSYESGWTGDTRFWKLEHKRNGNICHVHTFPDRGLIRIIINHKLVKELCISA